MRIRSGHILTQGCRALKAWEAFHRCLKSSHRLWVCVMASKYFCLEEAAGCA